ncbi:RpiB/LacA/LacB family sugar-phosphate isomerase [Pseudonocardia nematodicida]|uniref:RpiB/LacA/LacB family sugar-phosphate isomerase n=1 Tax=Pseudonocardia nematodicida TaxID=1206997 RepID=A0ABV1K6P5_9PSEU
MRIAIANDHAGFPLRAHVASVVTDLGHDLLDVGTPDDTPVDFPVISRRVTDLVRSGDADRGLLVCGTGVGAAIAANKVSGIRAAVIHDSFSARQCVEHDDVNVACVGAWIVGPRVATDTVTTYLGARFSTDPDFRRRVAQLAEMDGSAVPSPEPAGGATTGR